MSAEIKLDLGSVKVHKHVLEEIVAKSINDLNGVALIKPKVSDRLIAIIKGPARPGIKISVDENHEMTLHLSVNIQYGLNIPDVGRQIQDIVKQDIKKTLDISVKDVHVDIEGIERG
jgi:uncharacterized alkaline shock family protein YloU